MDDAADPFCHHPALRGLITPPEASYFRDLDHGALAARLRDQGQDPARLIQPEADREAARRAFLAEHPDGDDLWVFGYGSLMWDPGVIFTEIRRAQARGVARRFILRDVFGGRGTEDQPGLMVALDRVGGAVCHGLVFRIAAASVEDETVRLWKRERVGHAYQEAWVDAETDLGPVRAATFVADHGSEMIHPDLDFDTQVRFAATGTGFLGSSLDYLRGIATHLREFAIEDSEVAQLLAAAEAMAAGAD